MTKDADQLSKSALWQFTGSENWYRHAFNREVLFTDGAKHVADHGGAYWLLDEIALAQRYEPAMGCTPFQLWRLRVDVENRRGMLTCDDGDGDTVFAKVIDFTDFPVAEITLYFCNNTILLPSEY